MVIYLIALRSYNERCVDHTALPIPSPTRAAVVSVLPAAALAQDVMPPPGAVAPPPHDCIAINRPSRFPAEAVASLPSIITHKSEGNLRRSPLRHKLLYNDLPPYHPLSSTGWEKSLWEPLYREWAIHGL